MLLLGSTLFLIACTGGISIEDSYEVVTPTAAPTLTSPPPTPVAARADGLALAFYREWAERDYEAMYSLLSARTQAVVGKEAFVERYEDAMETARVIDVIAQPLSSFQQDAEAEFGVRVTWITAVVGQLVREHTVKLVYESDRWAILWDEGMILPELAGGNTLRLSIQTPTRAPLYDRGQEVLAFQGTGIVLSVIPEQLTDEEAFLRTMSALLDKSVADLRAIYADLPAFWTIPLGVVSADTVQQSFYAIEPYINGNGLETREGRGRMYNDAGIAPHLIGTMGFISDEARREYWARGYRPDERIGVSGLEAWAEPYLTGTRGGQLKLLSPAGEELDIIQEVQADPGRPVHASFDAAFQIAVQQTLAQAIASHPLGHAGAIVVLDVNTGAVRAMASYPTFDPSVFSEIRTTSDAELAILLNDPARPLINRATQGAYPPGSTFKIVTMSAGLFSDVYTADSRYFCTGSWTGLGDANIKFDWLLSGHGSVTLVQGLTRSCNTYSYEIGFVLDGRDPTIVPEMARSYGLGALTGIEVGEVSGLIPDPQWKLAALGDGWSAGDAVNMAIGQGFVLATPLQIANMTAAVANGGTLYRPTIVDRVEENRSTPTQPMLPEAIGQTQLSAEQLAFIQRALNDVTSGPWGTAVDKMAGLSVTTAGKTGTAQVAGEDAQPHSWFTGYAPAESPEIAVTVIMENAGEGSAVAAPIFRRIIELYYGLELTPYPWE